MDKVGNVSNVVSTKLKIDATKPVISNLTNSSGGNWAKSVTLSWQITENHSGTNKVEYSLNGGSWGALTSSEWYGLTRGNTRDDTIRFRVTDNVGNVSNAVSTALRIDNQAPTGTVAISATSTSADSVTVSGTVSDAHSGPQYVQIRTWTGDATWRGYNNNIDVIPSNGKYSKTINFKDIMNTKTGYTNQGTGTYYFGVVAYDKLGNEQIIGTVTCNYTHTHAGGTEGNGGKCTSCGTVYKTYVSIDTEALPTVNISRTASPFVTSGMETTAGIVIRKGESINLTASLTGVTNKGYSWTYTSGGNGTVSITNATSATATITGTKAGKVTVKVTSNGVSKTVNVFVYNAAVRYGQYNLYSDSARTNDMDCSYMATGFFAVTKVGGGLRIDEYKHGKNGGLFLDGSSDILDSQIPGHYFTSYYSQGATSTYEGVTHKTNAGTASGWDTNKAWVYSSTL